MGGRRPAECALLRVPCACMPSDARLLCPLLRPCCVQVDEEASIRANTTVLLGNLADHLSGEPDLSIYLSIYLYIYIYIYLSLPSRLRVRAARVPALR